MVCFSVILLPPLEVRSTITSTLFIIQSVLNGKEIKRQRGKPMRQFWWTLIGKFSCQHLHAILLTVSENCGTKCFIMLNYTIKICHLGAAFCFSTNLVYPIFFLDFIYLLMRDTEREAEAGSARQGASCRVQTQEPGISIWA